MSRINDGDGLYDYQERTAYIDGKEVVVTPKDTHSLTPNRPKGMWDKHVEMYNPTDIEETTHYEVVPFELPMKNYFIFDEEGHTVWIILDKKEESVFEKFKDYVVNSADIDGM